MRSKMNTKSMADYMEKSQCKLVKFGYFIDFWKFKHWMCRHQFRGVRELDEKVHQRSLYIGGK